MARQTPQQLLRVGDALSGRATAGCARDDVRAGDGKNCALFAGKTHEEVAELVLGLNKAAVQLDHACIRLFPDGDDTALWSHRVYQVARDYVERNPDATIPSMTLVSRARNQRLASSVGSDTKLDVLDRVISLVDELNTFPPTMLDQLSPSPWLLANEVRMLNERLLEALYVPVERRVLRRLNELARLYGRDPDGKVEIPLTQEELAGLAGSTRATVNTLLRDAQKRGLIELRRGRTRILDPDQLAHRAR